MPVALSPTERKKLEGILGMLGSAFEGERANAAAIIHRMAVERKCTIVELVMNSTISGPQSKPREEQKAYRQPPPPPEPEWRTQAEAILAVHAHRPFITQWEFNFLSDILERGWPTLSEKQAAIVARVWAKYLKINPAEDQEFG